MKLFRKAKAKPHAKPHAKPQAPDTTSSIFKLRETLDSLDKREKHIQKKIEAQLLDAKAKSAAKDKKGALFALKKKKMYEGEIDKLNGARMTLESQMIALEGSTTNMLIYNNMRDATVEMKNVREGLDVDQVDDVVDVIDEEMSIMGQIGNAIARPAGDIYDDDALLHELDMLEETDIEEQLLETEAAPTARPAAPHRVKQPSGAASKVSVGHDLPLAPSNAPVSAAVCKVPEDDVDARALRELEASMAM